jgi:hypothetical protein
MAHIRARGEEAKELAREAGKRARRWVVSRSRFRKMKQCITLRYNITWFPEFVKPSVPYFSAAKLSMLTSWVHIHSGTLLQNLA